MTGVLTPVSISARLQRDSGPPRRADCRRLPGRSPDVPLSRHSSATRRYRASRIGELGKLSLFVRPGQASGSSTARFAVRRRLHRPGILGARIKRTINLT